MISPLQKPLTDNTHHSQQTYAALVGFEPTIPASERPQTHALDITATGIGYFLVYNLNIKWTGTRLQNA